MVALILIMVIEAGECLAGPKEQEEADQHDGKSIVFEEIVARAFRIPPLNLSGYQFHGDKPYRCEN